jgi:hypothetical protein
MVGMAVARSMLSTIGWSAKDKARMLNQTLTDAQLKNAEWNL